MKKVALLLLFAALACTSAAPVPKQAHDPVSVSVTIESRPDSAEVYVAGKFIGTTPMVARLAPGEHAIKVSHPNRGVWERELTVIAGSPTRVMALLGAQ